MTSALVIGGKGLIGSVVTRKLLDAGVDVVCLEPKATPGRLGKLAEEIEIVAGDVRDISQIERLLADHDIDVILPLHFLRSDDVALELEVMVRGMWNIFDAAARSDVSRIAFPSSIRVYGPQWRHGDVQLNELSTCLSTRRYGIYKHLTEIAGRDIAASRDIEILGARVPVVYGPGIREGGADVVLAPYRAANGLDTVLPYSPDIQLCVAHVHDVADVFLHLALDERIEHDLYEIGGVLTSYAEIAEITASLTDAKVTFDEQPSDPEAEFAYLADNSRLRDELGLTHRSIEAGLKEFIDSAKEEA